MDDHSRIIVDYVRSLPRDDVVRWSTHYLSPDEPWTSRWVDVRIENDDAPPMGWVWTVIGEDDHEGTTPDQVWQYVWPYDLDVHEVWEPPRPPAVIGRRVGAWVVEPGASMPRDAAAALGQVSERQHVVLGGWSAATIGRALASWVAEHVGRTDLRFQWVADAELPPAVTEAARRARELDRGGKVRDLGGGLMVADGLMDDLLAMDPDDRASLVQVLREAHRRVVGNGGAATD